jgi:hypothetical protein
MYLNDIPVIDSHCHFFNLEYKSIKLHNLLSLSLENWDDEILKDTILYKRVIRDLADLFRTDVDEEKVLEIRDDLCTNKYTDYVDMLFDKSKIKGLVIDIGYKPAEVELEGFKNSVPAEVKYVYRIETLVDKFWNKKGNFDELYEKFINKIEDAIINGAVALKSIIGYRTGLKVNSVSVDEAREALLNNDEKNFRDFFFNETINICKKHDIPFQVHASFGESNCNLLNNNPLMLKNVLDNEEYKKVAFVLVHGGFPYSFEAGYMAAMYPNVYLDFSEMIPWLTFESKDAIKKVLDMAPFNKIMYGSDGFVSPELHFLGVQFAKSVVTEIIEELVQQRLMTKLEGYRLAENIFYKNAANIFGFNLI